MTTRQRHTSQLAAALVILGLLAGCLADTPNDRGPLLAHEEEWATYRVTADGGTAEVRVSYVWGEEVFVHMEAAYASGRVFDAKTWHDPSTGELLRSWEELRGEQIGVPNDILDYEEMAFPFGVHRILPAQTSFSPDADIEVPWALAPFGPQLAVAWQAGTFAWGEAEATVEHAGVWRVRVTGACQQRCDADAPGSVSWTLEGDWERLLPSRAVLDRPGHLRDVQMERIDHGQSGTVHLAVEPPAPPDIAPRAACGLAPCEPADWEPDRSYQFGLQALEASPIWQVWAASKTRIAPAWFPQPGCGSVVSIEYHCTWNFWVAAEPGPGAHVRVEAPMVDGQPVEPVLVSLEPDPSAQPPSHQFPRDQVRLDGLLQAVDGLPVTGWVYMHMPGPGSYPDVRGAYLLYVSLDETQNEWGVARISAETGQLLSLSINRGGIHDG